MTVVVPGMKCVGNKQIELAHGTSFEHLEKIDTLP